MSLRAATLVFSLVAVWSHAAAQAPEFSGHWHDGRAELNGYRWQVNRYGEDRQGQAVMIFVTEPFSEARKVKVDDPARDPRDTVDVLKLNLVRDFQTGIYDYDTMTSVFSRSGDFSPLKVSFSSAEWCGHVYEELLFERRRLRERYHSYFEGESTEDTIDSKQGGITEDNLFIVLRGLRGPLLEAGQQTQVPFLPGAFHRRLTHQPLAWTTAEIERLADPETVETPAGTFTAIVYVVRTAGGREGRFHVEHVYPHRIVRWAWGPGRAAESGELSGTIRVKYWQLNGNGNERYLEELGLKKE
jgi:hypothetical protein